MKARNEKHVCNGTMKKKSLELFARYGVELRSGKSQVFHPAYGRTTVVTPLQFALYETAIKAIDVHYQALIRIKYEPPADTSGAGIDQQRMAQFYHSSRQHHRQIAERDGFTLVEVELDPQVAIDDYYYCRRELGDLYHDLLD